MSSSPGAGSRPLDLAAVALEAWERLGDPVLVVDPQGRIQYASPSAEQLIAREEGELAGSRLQELVHGPEMAARDILRSCLRTREVVRGRLQLDTHQPHPLASEWEGFRLERGSRSPCVLLRLSVEPAPVRELTRRVQDQEQVLRDLYLQRRALGGQLQELTRENEELSALVYRDGLTGVLNRRAFDELLPRLLAQVQRNGQPLALLMIDLDFFKRINDSAGHQYGDQCLDRVGGLLSDSLRRPLDALARYGGEEFAVILPGASEPGAIDRALELRRSVSRAQIEITPGSGAPFLTLSIGISVADPAQDVGPPELIAAADAALLHAKRAGRDRVVLLSGRESSEGDVRTVVG